jgi:hypothetical protein
MEKDGEKKPFVPPEPPVEPAARDDVRAASSPVRCPYCHSDVSPDARDWVVCRACLARHHEACWNEGGACASCRATEAIGGGKAAASVARRKTSVVTVVLGLSVAVLMGVALLSAVRFERPSAAPPKVIQVVKPAPVAIAPRPPVGFDSRFVVTPSAEGADLLEPVRWRARQWGEANGHRVHVFKSGQGSEVAVAVEHGQDLSREGLESLRSALSPQGATRFQIVSRGEVRPANFWAMFPDDIESVTLSSDHGDPKRPTLVLKLKNFERMIFNHAPGDGLAIVFDDDVVARPILVGARDPEMVLAWDTGEKAKALARELIRRLDPKYRYPCLASVKTISVAEQIKK